MCMCVCVCVCVCVKDGKGLSIEELRAILSNFGDQMTSEECEEYLSAIEENCCIGQSGKIKTVAAEDFCNYVIPPEPEVAP